MKGSVRLAFALFLLVWAGVLVFVFLPDFQAGNQAAANHLHQLRGSPEAPAQNSIGDYLSVHHGPGREALQLPPRINKPRSIPPTPIPIQQVVANISSYLHVLHDRLVALAGPSVTPDQIWDAYVDVTDRMLC